MIEGGRRTRSHGDADGTQNQRIQRDPTGRCQHHADDGGEHDEQAHLGLGELQIIPPTAVDGGRNRRIIGNNGHRARVSRRPYRAGRSRSGRIVIVASGLAAGSGQSNRSKVTVQITSRAAPALCIVARPKGIPKCTMLTPMPISSSTAHTSRPPTTLNARPWARAKVVAPRVIKIRPTVIAPIRCVTWIAIRAGFASTPPV